MPGAGIGHHWQREVRRYSIVRGRSAPVYIEVGERLTSHLSSLFLVVSVVYVVFKKTEQLYSCWLSSGDSHRLRLQLHVFAGKGTEDS